MPNNSVKPKVVILAGGIGMRLREETEYKPKPMVLIGHRPILWHIMKIYMHHGFNDFIVCLGYKGEMIKEYFLNYETLNNDFTVRYDGISKITPLKNSTSDSFSVTLVDTGLETRTGGRIKMIEKYIDSDDFLLTYGDGVGDVNIKDLFERHMMHGKTGTVTGVHPESRFGELIINGDRVSAFSEKPQVKEGFISGGFFAFKKNFFKYLKAFDDSFFEQEPMRKLVQDDQLNVFKHEGFWACMDTFKDVKYLNDLWEQGKAPWKVWK